MTGIKNKISAFGFPRLIIMAFLGLLIVLMFLMDIPAPLTFSQCIVRVGINMVLGLAMVPGNRDELCSSIGNRMWAFGRYDQLAV